MNISFHVLVSVLIWQKKGLLLLRRRRNFKDIDTGRGLWELPGGKRDDGEEHDDFKFVQTAEELEKLPMLPTIKRYLLVALTGKVWLKLEERPRESTF